MESRDNTLHPRLLLVEDNLHSAQQYIDWINLREPYVYDIDLARSYDQAIERLSSHDTGDLTKRYSFAIIDLNLQIIPSKDLRQNGMGVAEHIVKKLKFPFRFVFFSHLEPFLKKAEKKFSGYELSARGILKDVDEKSRLYEALRNLEHDMIQYFVRRKDGFVEAYRYLSRFYTRVNNIVIPKISYLKSTGRQGGHVWNVFVETDTQPYFMLRDAAKLFISGEIFRPHLADINPFVKVKNYLVINVMYYESHTPDHVLLKIDGTYMRIPIESRILRSQRKNLENKINEWNEFKTKF